MDVSSMCIYESRLVGVGNDRIRPEIRFPNWVYHSLPYFSQWRHDRMVLLVWWAVALPFLTILVIWVAAGARILLPIRTTAQET